MILINGYTLGEIAGRRGQRPTKSPRRRGELYNVNAKLDKAKRELAKASNASAAKYVSSRKLKQLRRNVATLSRIAKNPNAYGPHERAVLAARMRSGNAIANADSTRAGLARGRARAIAHHQTSIRLQKSIPFSELDKIWQRKNKGYREFTKTAPYDFRKKAWSKSGGSTDFYRIPQLIGKSQQRWDLVKGRVQRSQKYLDMLDMQKSPPVLPPDMLRRYADIARRLRDQYPEYTDHQLSQAIARKIVKPGQRSGGIGTSLQWTNPDDVAIEAKSEKITQKDQEAQKKKDAAAWLLPIAAGALFLIGGGG